MHAHILYNDQILPADQKILTAGQLGVLSGWGVFTTLGIYDGVLFEFARHWRRMERDARLLAVALPEDSGKVLHDLMELVRRNEVRNGAMRLCVVRSKGGFWEGPGSGNASDLVAMTADLNRWRETVALGVAEQARHAASPFAGTKILSWSHNLVLAEKAVRDGFDEVILLNERGEVAECTSANIFVAKDGTTYTPPLSSGALPGITRLVLLEEINSTSMPVREKVLRLEDLYQADEVLISSTTRLLLPVDRILDRRIAKSGSDGWPVATRLREALRAYIREYVAKAQGQAVA